VLTGLVCLAMSPYIHADQSSAAVEQSTAEGALLQAIKKTVS
jgi:hypothetical protein